MGKLSDLFAKFIIIFWITLGSLGIAWMILLIGNIRAWIGVTQIIVLLALIPIIPSANPIIDPGPKRSTKRPSKPSAVPETMK